MSYPFQLVICLSIHNKVFCVCGTGGIIEMMKCSTSNVTKQSFDRWIIRLKPLSKRERCQDGEMAEREEESEVVFLVAEWCSLGRNKSSCEICLSVMQNIMPLRCQPHGFTLWSAIVLISTTSWRWTALFTWYELSRVVEIYTKILEGSV